STEDRGFVRLITLNRPERLNALNNDMRQQLLEVLEETTRDERVRAVVITGAGTSFCSGGDRKDHDREKEKPVIGRRRLKNTQRIIRYIMEMEKPVVAAVRGYAVGAGANLALAADAVVAGEDA